MSTLINNLLRALLRRTAPWHPHPSRPPLQLASSAHHLDLGNGCAGLLDEVWRVKPRLHVFGHVHYAQGKEAVYYDECQQAYESLMSRPGKGPFHDLISSARWADAFNVIWYGVGSILWKWLMAGPGSNNGGLMVNAAVMHEGSGKLSNPITVVDL
ncbi:hypothetical protein N0V88_003171 [Collariella sp. IMI 366227]|nr:hypothetical protein N0V88_003171 [Collariella sp. IMI 366227]